MNILITTFGLSWTVVPELIGFTNPDQFNLYKYHPQAGKIRRWHDDYIPNPPDQVWLVTTNGESILAGIDKLKNWHKKINALPDLKFFSYRSITEMQSLDEFRYMTDLIFRTVLKARDAVGNGKLYLSLAGGRKNMSADMQRAAEIFGFDALLHVADFFNNKIPIPQCLGKYSDDVPEALPSDQIKQIIPVVISGPKPTSNLVSGYLKIESEHYPLDGKLTQDGRTDLLEEIDNRLKNSSNLLSNSYSSIRKKEKQTAFHGFGILDQDKIFKLRDTHIGIDPQQEKEEIEWLNKFPKAELHCHLGGILSPEELIKVAKANDQAIDYTRKNSNDFDQWLKEIRNAVERNNSVILYRIAKQGWKKLRERYDHISEPITVAGFLAQFDGYHNKLEELIYNNYVHHTKYCGIGIKKYESLGDLQGSGILQSKESLIATCKILIEQCRDSNITYCEIRCSPENYTRGGLKSEEVVNIIMHELAKAGQTTFKLIIIGSRHKKETMLIKHIQLVKKLLDQSKDFNKMFAGFDLAGDEANKKPSEVRDAFEPLLKDCANITIHAGEGHDVENIWEAAYYLNADRIGHGLTLQNNQKLLNRFIDRRISIEMCPSSNFQIIGYRDFFIPETNHLQAYPLKKYLDQGLKITINTDDPGISLTDLTREYHKAACMTKGGLSKWEILQIIRNGFRSAFLPFDEKRQLLISMEEKILKLLNAEDNER